MIYLTSDLHFCHDRGFIYKPRGFQCVNDMNKAIVDRWNDVVNTDDDVYILGDVMLNTNDYGVHLLQLLKGRIHITIGNHDTNARIELYKNCQNVDEVVYASMIKYGDYRFWLGHYPTYTGDLHKKSLKQMLCSAFGHTHQTSNFYNDIPFMYHVGVDSHNCTPVPIEQVIAGMELKMEECRRML